MYKLFTCNRLIYEDVCLKTAVAVDRLAKISKHLLKDLSAYISNVVLHTRKKQT